MARRLKSSELLKMMERNTSIDSVTKAQKDLQGLLERRLDRLKNTYGLTRLARWDKLIQNYKGQNVGSLKNEKGFVPLLGPDTFAAYLLGKTKPLLCDRGGNLIEVLSHPGRMIFKNPYSNQIESWTRPRMSPVDYHSTGAQTTRYKSSFCKHVREEDLALEAFSDPIGCLRTKNELMLYMRCPNNIGVLAASNLKTDLVRVDCDRVARTSGGGSQPRNKSGSPRKLGYESYLHAYPCSQTDVSNDLGNCRTLLQKVLG